MQFKNTNNLEMKDPASGNTPIRACYFSFTRRMVQRSMETKPSWNAPA